MSPCFRERLSLMLLEHQDVITEFCNPLWWKELSKEMGSEVLLSGDGSRSSSGNKKKGVEPTIEVSNSNPFDALNSVDSDVEFGTNGGTSNLGNNKATPSGKLRLLDNDWNPLVPTGIVESDSEVKVVYDETANLMIPTSGNDQSDNGYRTNSLLEQWKDSYLENDDYDPYDDDIIENHDLSEHLQSICDDLDITASGGKKK
uniref:Uncharacterized protein n=1 Tax=Tanacetum cinerariifolium TaxID=118510 RepID=A0A6L2K5C8_TANCI|nr:hypothetical protein [Tanacetum cinerariifolium]